MDDDDQGPERERRWHTRRQQWCTVIHDDTDGTTIVVFDDGEEARVSTHLLSSSDPWS